MHIRSLVEVISAAHLSHYVESPFKERGGIMLIGPPASLKSAMVEVIDCYPNANIATDLTIKQAARLRDDFAGGKIATMAFTDFAKLYQRHNSTAANIEGFVRALTAEGFRQVNWEDSRTQCLPARAMVLGCMTQSFYMNKYTNWRDDGFTRRFLWSLFRLEDPNLIVNAIINETKIEFFNGNGHGFNGRIPTAPIPMTCTKVEAKMLSDLLRYQDSKEIGLTMLKKILSALKWKFPKERRTPMRIIVDFAESLGKDGADLKL